MISSDVAEFNTSMGDIGEIEDEAPTAKRSSSLMTWLIVMSMGMLLLPLFLVSTTIEEDNLRLEAELTHLEEALAEDPALKPEEEALRGGLTEIQGQLNVITAMRSNLETNHLDWPLLVATIGHYDSGRMTFTSMTQIDNLFTVEGQAENEGIIIAYANRLRDSGHFARVVVQSMLLKTPPTPQPKRGEELPEVQPGEKYVEFIILVELEVAQDELG